MYLFVQLKLFGMPSPSIPKKILSRKDEITAQFLAMVPEHMNDIINGRVDDMYHARDFAAKLFIHPSHLNSTVKLTTGKSICEIMEEATVALANDMLAHTEMSVADISYKLTYSEPTNFVKFYKSMTGNTPLQYRKSLKAVAVLS